MQTVHELVRAHGGSTRGLAGLRAFHRPSGAVFVIGGTKWGRHRHRLFVSDGPLLGEASPTLTGAEDVVLLESWPAPPPPGFGPRKFGRTPPGDRGARLWP